MEEATYSRRVVRRKSATENSWALPSGFNSPDRCRGRRENSVHTHGKLRPCCRLVVALPSNVLPQTCSRSKVGAGAKQSANTAGRRGRGGKYGHARHASSEAVGSGEGFPGGSRRQDEIFAALTLDGIEVNSGASARYAWYAIQVGVYCAWLLPCPGDNRRIS